MNAREREVARLRREAAELRERQTAAMDAGDADDALTLAALAVVRETVADGLERGEGDLATLRPREQSRTVNSNMLTVHRVAISEGRSKDPLAVAARKAGMSVTGLAKKLGVSKALLSMARRGDRSIKRDLCVRIEKLTGFAATKSNWPEITS